VTHHAVDRVTSVRALAHTGAAPAPAAMRSVTLAPAQPILPHNYSVGVGAPLVRSPFTESVMRSVVTQTSSFRSSVSSSSAQPDAAPVPVAAPLFIPGHRIAMATVPQTLGRSLITDPLYPASASPSSEPKAVPAPAVLPAVPAPASFAPLPLPGDSVASLTIEHLQRTVTRLQRELAAADAEHAAGLQAAQAAAAASFARAQNFEMERSASEMKLQQLTDEISHLRSTIAAAPSATNTQRAILGDATPSEDPVPVPAPLSLPAFEDHTSHDVCEAQIAQLRSTTAILQEQIQEWSERHALVVAEYEKTIADLAAKNVKQYLELDTSRDAQSRVTRQANVSAHVALDEQRAQLVEQFRAEQERLQAAARDAAADKDTAVHDLQRQLADFRAAAARQDAVKDQQIAALQRQVDSHDSSIRATMQSHDRDLSALRDELLTNDSAKTTLGEQLRALQSQHEVTVRRLEEAQRMQAAAAQADFQKAIADLKASHRADVDATARLHGAEKRDLEGRAQAAEQRLSKMATAHETALKEIRDMHAAKMGDMNARMAAEVTQLSQQYQAASRHIDVVSACVLFFFLSMRVCILILIRTGWL
jgi:hypothetical protein